MLYCYNGRDVTLRSERGEVAPKWGEMGELGLG
jgi:hypothetical protein